MNAEGSISRDYPSPARAAAAAILFAALLHVVWIGAWCLERYLEPRLGLLGTSGGRSLYWLLMKLLLWILPALAVIRFSGLSLREMMGFHRVRPILIWGGGVGLLLGTLALLSKGIAGQPLLSPDIGWPFLGGVIIAPIVEEFTFRGAILGALVRRYRFVAANTLTALLFLGIHLPGWYFQGRLLENLSDPAGGALAIFLLGWVFGYVVRKSKSVCAGTLCHILNNLFNA